MRRLLIAAVAGVALVGGAGCALPGRVPVANPLPVPSAVPRCVGSRVVQVADQPLGCDLTPPQQLAVRWPGSDAIEQTTFQARCDDMGGELVWAVNHDPRGEWECDSVDY